jgi:hypothetical protein
MHNLDRDACRARGAYRSSATANDEVPAENVIGAGTLGSGVKRSLGEDSMCRAASNETNQPFDGEENNCPTFLCQMQLHGGTQFGLDPFTNEVLTRDCRTK